jgi:integrase
VWVASEGAYLNKLSAKFVKGAKGAGMHNDGGGLYLQITPPEGKSWILRTKVYGKTKYIGIGPAHSVTLSEAREKARALRKIAREGGNPLAERQRTVITFKEAAQRVYESKVKSWKGGAQSKHAQGWINTLRDYAFPKIGDRPIHTITSADVLAVLTPIWHEKAETARRIRQRMSAVLDWAKAAGHYDLENPVTAVKTETLGTQTDKVKHFAALPYQQAPELVSILQARNAMSARLLQLSMFCVLRPTEMRFARWSEIDLENRVWTVPAERMKGRKGQGSDHDVPLSKAAISVLHSVIGAGREYVFPSDRRGKGASERPLSDNAVRALLKRLGIDATGHGMRSTFRQWGQEQTIADNDVLEMCLAHAVGTKVQRAYARSDLFEKRRHVMDAWSEFLTNPIPRATTSISLSRPCQNG